MLRFRLWKWMAIALALSPSVLSMAQRPLPFPVEGLGKGTVSLEGPWQFHIGDNPAWASPNWNDATGEDGWEQISALKPWGAQSHPSYDGYGWYRIHLQVTAGSGAPEELHVLMPKVGDVYEIYWNGGLIGRFGKMPPNPVLYYQQPTSTFGLGPMQSGVLAVRVWKAPPLSDGSSLEGGFESPPILGGEVAIARLKASLDYDWLRTNQFNFGLNSLYGLAAFLALLTWLSNRRQWMMLWMTGFCLSQPLMLFALYMRLPTPRAIALPLYQLAASLEDVSLWFLLLLLFRLEELPRLTKWVGRLAVIQIVLINLDGLVCSMQLTLRLKNIALAQTVDYSLTLGYTLLEALPLVLVVWALVRRRKLDAGRWTVAAFAFLTEMIGVTTTAAEQGRQYTHWTLADTLGAPLFTLRGNEINAQTLAGTCLLFSLLYAVQRYSADERRRQAALEQEFQNARELQKVLIPERLPKVAGFDLTSAYCPAQEVGGDFFQIIPIAGEEGGATVGSTLILLGDVSGKGVKAAMAVSLIVGTVRAFAESTSSPAEILSGLNRRLYGRMQGGFATCVAIRLAPDGKCTVASAGQTAPFLNGLEVDIPGAIPLGIMPSVSYEEATLQLNADDHLVLYTDGLLEARNSAGELYSFDRLQALFASRPTAEEATKAAVSFGQDDDITVLTLVRTLS